MDINWRPVFWEDVSQAPGIILPYVGKADIVKLSDEEAEWLFGLSASDALQHPDKAWPSSYIACSLYVAVMLCDDALLAVILPFRATLGPLPLCAAQVLEQLPGVKGVLVTGGGAGCSYAFQGAGGKIDYTGTVPVLKVESTDTTGAGDAFLGGFLASLVKVSTNFLLVISMPCALS